MSDDQPRPVLRNGLLFVCTGNGTRSQMAEAFARFIGPSEIQYYSAGLSIGPEIHQNAIRAMREVGVADFAGQKPKTMAEIPMASIATVITLAREHDCPELPEGVAHLPWPLPDADELGEEEHSLQSYRLIRDQIRELVSRLF